MDAVTALCSWCLQVFPSSQQKNIVLALTCWKNEPDDATRKENKRNDWALLQVHPALRLSTVDIRKGAALVVLNQVAVDKVNHHATRAIAEPVLWVDVFQEDNLSTFLQLQVFGGLTIALDGRQAFLRSIPTFGRVDGLAAYAGPRQLLEMLRIDAVDLTIQRVQLGRQNAGDGGQWSPALFDQLQRANTGGEGGELSSGTAWRPPKGRPSFQKKGAEAASLNKFNIAAHKRNRNKPETFSPVGMKSM